MDENRNSQNEGPDEDQFTFSGLIKSLVSISVGGLLRWGCHLMFGWSTGWCIGIGLLIGWALPGFIEGAKEELNTLKDD